MIDLLRRSLIAGAPVAAAGAALGGASAAFAAARSDVVPGAPLADGFIPLDDPREKLRALFRFERDFRDEGAALTTYHFLLYAFMQGQRPRPVVRFEGMEYSYFRRIGDLTWRIHAHNLSYPRDLTTGAFVSSVKNPFTGATLAVKPMRLLEDPGVLLGPKGYLQLDETKVHWADTHFVLRTEGDLVKAEHIRPAPEVWPTMFIESSVSVVPKQEYDDPKITSLMFQTSGFYVFPFPAWMQMGDAVGHMLGAWNGRKIPGPENLPREFLARAKAEDAALLAPRWSEFDRPLKPELRGAV